MVSPSPFVFPPEAQHQHAVAYGLLLGEARLLMGREYSSLLSLGDEKKKSFLTKLFNRRGAAPLCASGPWQSAGYPDRHSGPDTEEPDAGVPRVRDCGRAGWVTAGSPRPPDRGPLAVLSECERPRVGRGG